MSKIVIQPYGARLFDTLHELASELDLADSLLNELQALGQ